MTFQCSVNSYAAASDRNGEFLTYTYLNYGNYVCERVGLERKILHSHPETHCTL